MFVIFPFWAVLLFLTACSQSVSGIASSGANNTDSTPLTLPSTETTTDLSVLSQTNVSPAPTISQPHGALNSTASTTGQPVEVVDTDLEDSGVYDNETANSSSTVETDTLNTTSPPLLEEKNLTLVDYHYVFEDFLVPEDLNTPKTLEMHHEPPMEFLEPSPFDLVSAQFADFQSQVVALHSELCGTVCHFSYDRARLSRAIHCSKCACDHLCHVYGDCCPDVQLLTNDTADSSHASSTREESQQLTGGQPVYTCEVSHLKPRPLEGDYGNYYSMINYCPRNGSLHSPSGATHTNGSLHGAPQMSEEERQRLEHQCENRDNSRHWLYVRPWTSDAGVVYRNQFCAQCHGQDISNMTAWRTRVTCDADLLRSASSVTEAYFLAANTSDCDVRFSADKFEVERECTSLQLPIISSCNQTGLWSRYDDKVARACASFTAPVLEQYRNAFCLMCNEDLSFHAAEYIVSQGFDANNIARVSFFALLDIDESEGDDWSAAQTLKGNETAGSAENSTCDVGFIRDPVQCECRPLSCGEGFQVMGNNCSAIFASTNYFGFEVCTRFQVQAAQPFRETDVLHQIFTMLTYPVGIKTASGMPRLDCEDNTRATFDVRIQLFSHFAVPLEEMVNNFHTSLDHMVSWWSADSTVNLTVMAPAASCSTPLDWLTSIPDSCPTKNDTLTLGLMSASGPVMHGFDVEKVSFSPLHNTTFCPHVTLTEAEFSSYTDKLFLLNLTTDTLMIDVLSKGGEIVYLMCVGDYLVIDSATSTCDELSTIPGKNGSLSAFQDTWTTIGVISTVCTCVSLLCLLAVVVTYVTLPPLRAGSGQSTLAMTCTLFVAQALHEVGIEQFDFYGLCLALALLIHFFWLSAVFMMTSCTLQLFLSMTFPIRARMLLSSTKMLVASLLSSFGLSSTIIGMTILGNELVHGDLGYPAPYVCFIRRSLSRQLSFGFPLGAAVLLNVILFVVTIVHVHRRPNVRTTRQDHVSLLACFRLSVVTGACWLSLFLLAIPGTRPWLEYVFVVLLGLQGLLLATTLLLNKRVYCLWKDHFNKRAKFCRPKKANAFSRSSNSSDEGRTDSSAKYAVTTFSSLSEASSVSNSPIIGKKTHEQA